MLPAVVKLCCGISYPHLRSLAGLQRTAVAVIGEELTHLQRWGRVQHHMRTHGGIKYNGKKITNKKSQFCYQCSLDIAKKNIFAAPGPADVKPLKEDKDFCVKQGQEAMRKALCMLEDTKGWKVESEGDVICSKVVAGAGKVFRLEAVLEASVEELYDLLFVLKHVGPETIITHEVSAETAGNRIGQRDFLSVRHSCKQKSSVYLGGAAIQLASFPPQAGFGWLPKFIVNQALPRAQLDFTRHLRRRLTARATLG
ncbi:hypothetical protein F7725_014391 [Dissostichus mawsoni]|uniref:START domain-containing protein 1 n=1 Tax=Dissostichus mawsoni TaxID=36200 RepID=A0A7J5YWX4_DISMA|nr:hypothetical protein F7725_014391 [Dissostichus mawsoni]